MLPIVKNCAYFAGLGGAVGATFGGVIAAETCVPFFAGEQAAKWMGSSEAAFYEYAGLNCTGQILMNSVVLCAGLGASCGLIYEIFKRCCGQQQDNIQAQPPSTLKKSLTCLSKIVGCTALGYVFGNLRDTANCSLSFMQHPAQYERCLQNSTFRFDGAITGLSLGVVLAALSLE